VAEAMMNPEKLTRSGGEIITTNCIDGRRELCYWTADSLKSFELRDSRSKFGNGKVGTFAVGKLNTFAFVENESVISETNPRSISLTSGVAGGELLGWK
jgi:hypothetical protein